MPISVAWADDNHTILRVLFREEWSSEDLFRVIEGMRVIIDDSPRRVAIVLDHTQTRHAPGDLLSKTARVGQLDWLNHPNTTHAVVVGAEGLVAMFYSLLTTSYPRLITVDDPDEAYTIIRAEDEN